MRVDADAIALHGPGFDGGPVPAREHVLLLRNIRRLTRGAAEARLLRRSDLGVYDLDDGLPWDDGTLPGLGHWTKRPFSRARVARRAAGAADRLIVGNEVLAEWATDRSADVRLIPTCVEPGDYEVRSSWELPEPPVIGWIGSPATEHYLVDIAPALADVHRVTGARLHMISGPGEIPPELAGFTTRESWFDGVEVRIAGWDVGLMPLRDGVYERAKCGYKLLQYAASGVPVVGSPVGVNASMISEMDGLGPTGMGEWSDSLIEVLNEPSGRREARAMSGLRAVERYSYDAWQDAWVDAVGW
jgi:glycosyltransferase involved in cell wall biosynthesis